MDQLIQPLMASLLQNKEILLGPIGFSLERVPFTIGNPMDISQYILSISSFGFCIIFIFLFFVLNIVLTDRLMNIRLSMALFTAGMLGSGIDMIFKENIFNYIVLFNVHMNLQDIYIVLGSLLTLIYAIQNRSILFRKNNLRRILFVERDQYIFCFHILIGYLLCICAFYTFFFSFMKIVFSYFTDISSMQEGQIMTIFSVLYFVLSLSFFLIMIAFAAFLSNKIYGPVYAFKKHIRDVFLNKQNNRPFKLREGDHFKDMQDLITQLKSEYLKEQK